MKIERSACRWCGRAVVWWDGCPFEMTPVPAGSHPGRAIVAVRVPGGAMVRDVRSLAVEPESVNPQHRCSESLPGASSLQRAG
jgi:hypothetical protein